ncbi:uncharacterized protein LOC122463617 [Chelonia mydas]|uniref:uncharacterized protein LOC122463617 n=1 Tax=Chelonia mydas TaxID=8469 RepID=UPI001CA9A540|nr:uncharacterized protein LOC122463617 [Chelonia mydas]
MLLLGPEQECRLQCYQRGVGLGMTIPVFLLLVLVLTGYLLLRKGTSSLSPGSPQPPASPAARRGGAVHAAGCQCPGAAGRFRDLRASDRARTPSAERHLPPACQSGDVDPDQCGVSLSPGVTPALGASATGYVYTVIRNPLHRIVEPGSADLGSRAIESQYKCSGFGWSPGSLALPPCGVPEPGLQIEPERLHCNSTAPQPKLAELGQPRPCQGSRLQCGCTLRARLSKGFQCVGKQRGPTGIFKDPGRSGASVPLTPMAVGAV